MSPLEQPLALWGLAAETLGLPVLLLGLLLLVGFLLHRYAPRLFRWSRNQRIRRDQDELREFFKSARIHQFDFWYESRNGGPMRLRVEIMGFIGGVVGAMGTLFRLEASFAAHEYLREIKFTENFDSNLRFLLKPYINATDPLPFLNLVRPIFEELKTTDGHAVVGTFFTKGADWPFGYYCRGGVPRIRHAAGLRSVA